MSRSGTGSRPISILGYRRERPVLSATTSGRWRNPFQFNSAAYVRLRGFVLEGSNGVDNSTDVYAEGSAHNVEMDASARWPATPMTTTADPRAVPLNSGNPSPAATAGDLAQLLYSGLFTYDDRGAQIPDVAIQVPTVRNGGISSDGRTVTYHLMRGVRFSDGVVLTPPRSSVLEGVSLRVVEELCAALDIRFEERPLGVHDCLTADEALDQLAPHELAEKILTAA